MLFDATEAYFLHTTNEIQKMKFDVNAHFIMK